MPPPKDPIKYEEWRKKISLSNTGKKQTQETIDKRRESRKGYRHSEETKNKIGKANKGKKPAWTGKTRPDMIGRKHSEETKKKMSDAKKGKIPKNINLARKNAMLPENVAKRSGDNHYIRKRGFSEEHRNKLLEINHNRRGKHLSDEHKEKISRGCKGKIGYWKGKKLSTSHVKNALRRRDKTSLEKKFEDIVNINKLPYKFVGNGGFFIGRRNPDFIHNTHKIAIEVYCRYFKNLDGRNEDVWKEDRLSYFNKNGWGIYFFNEIEVNNENILDILGDKNDCV